MTVLTNGKGALIGSQLVITLSQTPTAHELSAPTFNWVRLAQRVPVRIHLDEVPDGVLLAAGMTCTVVVEPQPER